MNEKLVVKAIPSSFVTRPLKIRGDAGAGEAKLFVGPKKKEEEYNSFFEFGKGYKYVFSKDNLLEYLNNTTLQLFQKNNVQDNFRVIISLPKIHNKGK